MLGLDKITSKQRKTALLAAVSVLAASTVSGAAANTHIDPAGHPIMVEAQLAPSAVADSGHTDEQKPVLSRNLALLAAAAGALAGLVKLIGAKRVAEVVSQGVAKTAKVAVNTTVGVVRSIGSVASSPLRFLGILFGLALFALTGVGIYGLEWTAGLVSGAAISIVSVFGILKTRAIFRPMPAKANSSHNMPNRN